MLLILGKILSAMHIFCSLALTSLLMIAYILVAFSYF